MDDRTENSFAMRIRLQRICKDMYCAEFADILHHSIKTQRAYEREGRIPSVARVREIADTLGIPAPWLLGYGPTFAYECTTDDYVKTVNAAFQSMADKITELEDTICELTGVMKNER